MPRVGADHGEAALGIEWPLTFPAPRVIPEGKREIFPSLKVKGRGDFPFNTSRKPAEQEKLAKAKKQGKAVLG